MNDMIRNGEKITLGELAQLVERCDRTAEVRDSSSLFSIWTFILSILVKILAESVFEKRTNILANFQKRTAILAISF
jgi:hypothetical protein